MTRAILVAIIALAAFGIPTAQGAVTFWHTSGTVLEILENQVVNGERQITILGYGEPGMVVQIAATSGSNPIRYIRVASARFTSTSGNVVLSVVESGGTIPHIREISAISASPEEDGEVWIGEVTISGTVGDPSSPHVGWIAADIVGDIRSTGGDISADIIAGPRLFGGTSTVTRVQATAGDISGDIFAHYGDIREVNAGDDIGSVANPVFIEAQQGIRLIEGDSVYAGVDAEANGQSSSGSLWRLRARTGDFDGYLFCEAIDSSEAVTGISVAGDLLASVIVDTAMNEPLSAATLGASTLLWFGSAVGSSATMTFTASQGLLGQVIVNGANGSASWSADATVNSVTLSPRPDYTNLSANIGGGAIGVVPFDFHATDCAPAHNSNVNPAANPGLSSVRIRHYGAVRFASGTMPYTVTRKQYDPNLSSFPECCRLRARPMSPAASPPRPMPTTRAASS